MTYWIPGRASLARNDNLCESPTKSGGYLEEVNFSLEMEGKRQFSPHLFRQVISVYPRLLARHGATEIELKEIKVHAKACRIHDTDIILGKVFVGAASNLKKNFSRSGSMPPPRGCNLQLSETSVTSISAASVVEFRHLKATAYFIHIEVLHISNT